MNAVKPESGAMKDGASVELGSEMTLPSGVKIRITAPSDPDRPWQAMESKQGWHVGRRHAPPGEQGAVLYYGGKPVPVQLCEGDARELAVSLNKVRPGIYRR
ncbi:MAG: hypothetical protein M3Y55_01770 [Pseudomonadota bacterium]|nr:hypothetical protein [Pseudomonadota bacterium]